MRAYQEEYLALLGEFSGESFPKEEFAHIETFIEHGISYVRRKRDLALRGTELLRRELFPVLDNILSASTEDVRGLEEFAGELMRGQEQRDVGLHLRIHMALLSYARHRKDTAMLIKELYYVGMSLYNIETMLTPNDIRLYRVRERMCFSEAASYFESDYYEEADPETRGYIHRSMGNIVLTYDEKTPENSIKKLQASNRSIKILSDPDIRAKTPELPWDVYLYKSHQERTTLLAFLRSGMATPETFAQVLESAQTIQERQLMAARERGEPLQPRWQYAYMAAKYHCGAMTLPDLLDGIYALSTARGLDDFGLSSMFCHVSAPAIFMEYSKKTTDPRAQQQIAVRIKRMTERMLAWLRNAPRNENDEQLMFYIRQFLYVYRETEGAPSFWDVAMTVIACRNPTGFLRMYNTGSIARLLTLWAVEDCPEKLVGLPGISRPEDAIWNKDTLADLAFRAGRLYDVGMIHFIQIETGAPRGLFEDEEDILSLHTQCGAAMLSQFDSTRDCVDVAKGHHLSYDEKSGFPVGFSSRQSPMRAMIYIVAASDALACTNEETASRYRPVMGLEEAVSEIIDGSGTRYAPFTGELLQRPGRVEELRRAMEEFKREGFLEMYRRRSGDGENKK